MDGVVGLLHHLATTFGSEAATLVLQEYPQPVASEEYLGVAVFTLATSAVQGLSMEEKEVAIIGLERCLSVGVVSLDADAVNRLQASVVERVLRNFDAAGDALATKASQRLLMPGAGGSTAATEALRCVLALLFRCTGATQLPADQLLELTRGDVALAVALIADGVRDKPAGLPRWSSSLVQTLHLLTTPDAFVRLLQLTDPARDFNNTAMSDFADRQMEHKRVLALSLVQFELLDRALLAAEEPSHRQSVVAAIIRTLHNLTSGKRLVEPGRLISRWVAMDFSRFGFRFLAPLVRKLIDDSRSSEVSRLLRFVARTLSWLCVHAEFDGSAFLAESLKPLVAEWTLRGLKKPAPPTCLAALAVLAGNCGALAEGRLLDEIHPSLAKMHRDVGLEVGRSPALTSSGQSSLTALGFDISAALSVEEECPPGVEEEDEPCSPGLDYDYEYGDDGWLDARWFTEDQDESEPEDGGAPVVDLEVPAPCNECQRPTRRGLYGEGYFEGMWYCVRCWNAWEESDEGAVAISPWPLDCGNEDPREQRGASAALLRAPGHLRCGINGSLLHSQAVQVPASAQTAYPVSFEMRNLQKWHRRSGGKCPITGHSLDLRSVMDAAHVLQEVQCWLASDLQ